MLRLLTFNSHEAYVYDLARLGYPMDVVVDLPGHHVVGWDDRMRPCPPNVRTIGIRDVAGADAAYDCVIAHNITDLLAVKAVGVPKILVLHSSLAGRIKQEGAALDAARMTAMVRDYLAIIKGTLVVVSEMKRASWGLPAIVIPLAVDLDDYQGYRGEVAGGLRVASSIVQKKEYLNWSLHEAVFRDVPCEIVGHNPELGIRPAADWEALKELYRSHRFYVHTAAPGLEDGYNLSVLEAMATGMPVIASAHRSCPVVDGESGFVSDDPEVLRAGARRLMADLDLARAMGQKARETVRSRFPMARFVESWNEAIGQARARFRS